MRVVTRDVHDRFDQAVTEIAAQHHGLFAAAHLELLGIGEHERRHRVRTGRWIEIHQRVYRVAGSPVTWRSDVLAACWAGGARAVASFRSAAALHGLPGSTEQVVEITCPRWRRARHDGLLVHEARALPERDVTIVDAIPVTTVERTIFDLCSVCGNNTIDFAIDNALRRELASFETLTAVLQRLGHRGVKGTRLLRSLLAARDPLRAPTDSEREAMLIDVLRANGLPEAVRQFVIRDEQGIFVGRVDVAYPDQRIAMEYDSYQEHVGKQQLVRDSRRRNAISALGWTVLVATAEDVRLGSAQAFVSAVRRARRS